MPPDRPPFTAELGAALKAARLAAGMSQQAAALAVGVAVGTWSRYERGELPVSEEVLERARGWKDAPPAVPADPAAAYALGVARERAASARRLVALIRDSANSALGDLDALLVSGVFAAGDAPAHPDAPTAPVAPPAIPTDPDELAAALAEYERGFREFVARQERGIAAAAATGKRARKRA